MFGLAQKKNDQTNPSCGNAIRFGAQFEIKYLLFQYLPPFFDFDPLLHTHPALCTHTLLCTHTALTMHCTDTTTTLHSQCTALTPPPFTLLSVESPGTMTAWKRLRSRRLKRHRFTALVGGRNTYSCPGCWCPTTPCATASRAGVVVGTSSAPSSCR